VPLGNTALSDKESFLIFLGKSSQTFESQSFIEATIKIRARGKCHFKNFDGWTAYAG